VSCFPLFPADLVDAAISAANIFSISSAIPCSESPRSLRRCLKTQKSMLWSDGRPDVVDHAVFACSRHRGVRISSPPISEARSMIPSCAQVRETSVLPEERSSRRPHARSIAEGVFTSGRRVRNRRSSREANVSANVMAATYRTNVRRLDSPGVLAIARTSVPAAFRSGIVPPGKCRALLQLPRLVKQFLELATAGLRSGRPCRARGSAIFFPSFPPELLSSLKASSNTPN